MSRGARCPYCLGALAELDALSADADAGAPGSGLAIRLLARDLPASSSSATLLPVVRCERCDTPHHAACFEEHGGCTILGCGARTVVEVERAPGRAALHPFLPLLERGERPGGFLAMELLERSPPGRGRRRLSSSCALLLEAPAAVSADARVDGLLDATSSAPVRGQGLRLQVESWLLGGRAEELLVAREEAVLLGSADRGWLERLRVWSRPAPRVLLRAGTTRLRFSFDAGPLCWRGPLPEGVRDGPRQQLRLRVVLDGDSPAATRAHAVALLPGRLRLEPLALRARAERLQLWPPAPDEEGRWLARPLVHEGHGAAGLFAVRRSGLAALGVSPSTCDVVLAASAPEPGVPRVVGTIAASIAGRRAPGPLALEAVVEWRAGARLPWQVVAAEEGAVCDAPARGADATGRHAFEFEYAAPWQAPPEGQACRVRLRAALRHARSVLRSEWAVVVLRRRRRPMPDGGTPS